MRLVTYRRDVCAAARLGALVETTVVDLALLAASVGKQLPATMLDFIDLGPQAVKSTTQLLKSFEGDWPVGTALPLSSRMASSRVGTGWPTDVGLSMASCPPMAVATDDDSVRP